MTTSKGRPPSIHVLQETLHGTGHDYVDGSPHLRHRTLYAHVVHTLHRTVGEIIDARGSCDVLEIGAGHGAFTDHLAAAGARVEVTEMSRPSVESLRHRFRNNSSVRVTAVRESDPVAPSGPVDLVVCISVLHHIPDYVAAVDALVERIRPGGAFLSFQDPNWYPRRTRTARIADRAAFLAWRLPRGDLRVGLRNVMRRRRDGHDEGNPYDMVEYHVVRQGVDERALVHLLTSGFEDVTHHSYWSTQSTLMQSLGSRMCPPNTFGLLARGRRDR